MAFEVATNLSAEHFLRSAAILALSLNKCMLHRAETDVALLVIELRAERVAAIGILAAVDGTARDERGKFRDADAKELLREDVVGTLPDIGNFCLKPDHQALGYLAEKDTRLGDRVEEGGSR